MFWFSLLACLWGLRAASSEQDDREEDKYASYEHGNSLFTKEDGYLVRSSVVCQEGPSCGELGWKCLVLVLLGTRTCGLSPGLAHDGKLYASVLDCLQ